MTVSIIDYVKEAEEGSSSLLNQSPIYLAFLDAIVEYYHEQQKDFIWLSKNLLNIEVAEKWHLDFIGMIVGQPRLLVSFNTEPYFGFEGSYQSETFSTASNPTLGGYWNSMDTFNTASARKLTDEEYRRIIKARVIFNNSFCTRTDLLNVINLITGNTSASITRERHGLLKIRAVDDSGLLAYFMSRLDLDDNILPIAYGIRAEQVEI